MSVVSAAPKWFMKLISQTKNIATCKLLTFVYPLCSVAYFENHECLFLLFPSVNFLTACQILETTVLCYCKCITNEKDTYVFDKSAVFSTRSDFFLEVSWSFCPMLVSQSTLRQTPPAVVGSCHSFGLCAAIPDHQACALGSVY